VGQAKALVINAALEMEEEEEEEECFPLEDRDILNEL